MFVYTAIFIDGEQLGARIKLNSLTPEYVFPKLKGERLMDSGHPVTSQQPEYERYYKIFQSLDGKVALYSIRDTSAVLEESTFWAEHVGKIVGDCVGCFNIRHSRFPFIKEHTPTGRKYSIDMEDQGVDLVNKRIRHLRIIYCPVCGTKLT